MALTYTDKGAIISADGRYRYRLWREWRDLAAHDPKNWRSFEDKSSEPKACVFVMLNPSTADGETDDPTIRRCVGFARAWKFERIEVVNLFAYRATSPKALLALNHHDDQVGADNRDHVTDVCADAGRIVCAWGSHGGHLGQDETVLGWMMPGEPRWALGLTDKGFPRHPLYVPGSQELERFRC